MENKEEKIKQTVERASARFEEKGNCSQSVLFGCLEAFQLGSPDLLNIAAGFGGGFGRSGCACGAITGAVMALGLKYGGGDPEVRTAMNEKVKTLYGEFTKQFGTPCCKELNGNDFTSVEHRIRCTSFVRASAEQVAKLLTD